MPVLFFFFALFAPATALAQSYTIASFAGGALPINIRATDAALSGPESVVVDKSGNVYFSLNADHLVLKMDAVTGILTAAAGTGTAGFSGDNGPATNAQLYAPWGLALDSAGSLYISDTGNNRIRKVANGVITTVAGNGSAGFSGDNGPATAAQFQYPRGICLDSSGGIYVADPYNGRIRKIANGVITTVAGNGTAGFGGDGGPAISAQLNGPSAVAVDSGGNLFIADTDNFRVREVTSGGITTVVGNGTQGFATGTATGATLGTPWGIIVDSAGSLYISDRFEGLVRKVTNGIISNITGGLPGFKGDGGPALKALVNFPMGLALDSAGNLYIADFNNNRIRKVSSGIITTLAGGATFGGDNGPPSRSLLYNPLGVAVDPAGNLLIADDGNERIRKVANGTITTVAGNGMQGFSGDAGPAANAALNDPFAVATDSAGSVYIADINNHRVRKVANGLITTVASDGTSTFSPESVAVDSAGNLFIADSFGKRIYKVANGIITAVAGDGTLGSGGDGGPAISAQFRNPVAIALDVAGNLYVADAGSNSVRKIVNGTITTVAGNGTAGFSGDGGLAIAAQLNLPTGVAVDSAGSLYIAESQNNRIRKVVSGVITTIAGNGTAGFSGDGGPATNAQLSGPYGVAVATNGQVYITDRANNRIRILTPIQSQTITFGPLSSVTYGAAPFTILATASSGLTVALASATGGICTVAGVTVTIVAAGTCSITATQPGNAAFDVAPPVTQGFRVGRAPQSITFVVPDNVVLGTPPFALVASATSGQPVSFASNSTGICTVNGTNAVIVAAGRCSISASVGGSGNYLAASTITRIFSVNSPGSTTQIISFGPLPDLTFGAPSFTVAATASSGIAVVFTALPGAVCALTGSTIRIVGGGVCSITATQSGNATFGAATPITQSFTVNAAVGGPVITKGGIGPLFTSSPIIQPGSWINIYGTNLATAVANWNGDFPTTLGGVTVTINSQKAYLLYVSPTQIDAQAPDDTARGTFSVTVTNERGSWTSSEVLGPVSPSFSLLDGAHVAGIILRSDGSGAYGAYDIIGPTGKSLGYQTVAAKAGDIVELFGVGFGPTNPSVSAGQPITGGGATTNTLQLVVGNKSITPSFTGISSSAGLYQINVTIPSGLASGDQPLVGLIGGVETPAGVAISIQ